VAVLIALAQKQVRGQQRLGDRDRWNLNDDDGDDGDVRHELFGVGAASQMLLVTSPGDTTWLHIYTSNITPEFLDKLDRPSDPSPADADTQCRLGMVISHQRLAFEPYDTLSQRLTAVVAVQQTIGKTG